MTKLPLPITKKDIDILKSEGFFPWFSYDQLVAINSFYKDYVYDVERGCFDLETPTNLSKLILLGFRS